MKRKSRFSDAKKDLFPFKFAYRRERATDFQFINHEFTLQLFNTDSSEII